MQYLEFMFGSGFWRFLGCFILFYLLIEIPFRSLLYLVNRILRHWNIRKHGYPPSHCDADGDFIINEKQE